MVSLTSALTAGGLGMASQAQASERVMVEKNHATRIALKAPAGSVIVGNPDIADVTVVDSRTVFIMGKGFGSSSVTITDQMGHPLFDGEVVVTTAQKGTVTIFKGLKSSLAVCSNICVTEDNGTGGPSSASSGGGDAPSLGAATAAVSPAMGQAMGQGAGAIGGAAH